METNAFILGFGFAIVAVVIGALAIWIVYANKAINHNKEDIKYFYEQLRVQQDNDGSLHNRINNLEKFSKSYTDKRVDQCINKVAGPNLGKVIISDFHKTQEDSNSDLEIESEETK